MDEELNFEDPNILDERSITQDFDDIYCPEDKIDSLDDDNIQWE